MQNKSYSSLNLLLDSVEGTNLLLEYYAAFSRRLFSAKDFKTIMNILYEELKKIYIHQHIEIIFTHTNNRLVKFVFDESSHQVVPADEFYDTNTLYNHVLEKRQILLTNNYATFCENLNLNTANLPASSWLGIPLVVRGKVLGALVLWDDNPERFLRVQDKQFLYTISNMVSFAIENIYLYDYIVEKNGSYKLFETILPKGAARNSTRNVIAHLMRNILESETARYTGLFLTNRFYTKWRTVEESYRDSEFANLAIELLKDLPKIPQSIFDENEYFFWHSQFVSHPLAPVLRDALQSFPVNSALVFPFQINYSYQGVWIIAFQRKMEQIKQEELQFYRFIFYIITQLLEKKTLLEKKARYETYMKHLERMKIMGELASGAAHHLNNILSVIIGKTHMLQKKLQNTPFARDLELIYQAANDGANSIRRLQNAVAQNPQKLKKKAVNINHLIQEVVEIARPRFEREAQSLGIRYDLKLNLGRIKPVMGDAGALREVFLNLLNNALDAMPNGGKVVIQTSMKANQVLVFVSDTGMGIPEEIREKIFEPFFTTKGEKGNGLGLSIAADIIQRHNGKIYVDSIPKKGSIFMIELPVISEEAETPVPHTPIESHTSCRILLVDDEGIVRETLAEMLEDEGFEVVTASNAEEAMLKFRKYQCDVIFTDLSMPGMNGIQLAQRMKKQMPDIPIFIITGWNQLDKQLIESNKFIDGIIQKPFNIARIRRELHRVLNSNGTASRTFPGGFIPRKK
ncbi:MAG: response regulator [Calditrichaeota bacterium]|nr:response regulator [Calditrichota bacterium]